MGKTAPFFIGYRRDSEDEKPFKIPPQQLLTHAVVLGASGSGKTVLCKSIVEEAILNEIPVIAFDPKGDIGALGITFGKDFSLDNIQIHAQVAAKDQGQDPDTIATNWITDYQTRLEESFGENYAQIEGQYSEKVAVLLITPKNPAGIQISLTPVFSKPKQYERMMQEVPDAVLNSLDLKIQILLSRCGLPGKSSTSSRVVFLNEIIRYMWENEKEKVITLSDLIELVEQPPIKKIGNLSVDKFISKNKREELARLFNGLMVRSVPGVELDFEKLIHLAKKEGKTPIIIFDLRQIPDETEKSSFVAEVLEKLQRWSWAKGGTSRLRALVYFDELYGFMPAGSRKPPSKTALLLLIKQARSTGLGLILATQNPGDLDYRGLSNISTWMLGKLTTKQDIKKVEDTLRANFEAAHPPQANVDKKFKDLMSSIRALDTGEFIFYNTKTGVVPIKSRWLLSLHKGPLTNEEIQALTLLPPQKTEQEKLKTTTRLKEQEAQLSPTKEQKVSKTRHEDESIVIQPETLTTSKPTLKASAERYIKPKISLKNKKQLTSLISDRLNLRQLLSKESLKIFIRNINLYYSPYYHLSVLVKLDTKITSKKIPIQIKHLMHRFFDLSTEIHWDKSSFEGIFPSSIPPTDIRLEPPAKKIRYYDAEQTKLSQIKNNIEWYFSNTPFTEADSIYLKKIRKYEREKIAELSGTGSKRLQQLSDQISKLEEQIQDQQDKLKIKQTKLDHLQDDKAERLEEDRPVKAIGRSISSTERKISIIDEKISQYRRKMQQKEQQRQNLLVKKKKEYKELKATIDQLKQQEPPKELYKLDPTNIAIEDDIVYWIPRMQASVELERIDENVRNSFIINLNLYNGNGNLNCTECGQEDTTTKNYYEELISDEISPPMFLCEKCLDIFCSTHIDFCYKCNRTECFEHMKTCTECNNSICETCQFQCTTCGEYFCSNHIWLCSTCGKPYCYNEREFIDKKTKNPICTQCSNNT